MICEPRFQTIYSPSEDGGARTGTLARRPKSGDYNMRISLDLVISGAQSWAVRQLYKRRDACASSGVRRSFTAPTKAGEASTSRPAVSSLAV
jgi:hypothetical protein